MASEKHIPGIFNWCDRWCEKCAFIHQCAVGAVELEMAKNDDPEKLEAYFEQMAERMEEEDAYFEDAEGIEDFEEPDEEEEALINAEMNLERIIIDTHPLPELAGEYDRKAFEWLSSDEVKQYAENTQKRQSGDIKTQLSDFEQSFSFQESIEIINWYVHFIFAKCSRMIAEAEDEFWEEYPVQERPYNGTAKITLLAIDQSIAAWAFVLELLPHHQVKISRFMDQLKKLKNMIHAHFPDAEKFIRPGFDE